MALAIGRKTDHVRVLSDLSGLVVSALLDDADHGPEDDAFTDALRRYREEGAPDVGASWRTAISPDPIGARAAEVLRRLTRDLLKDVSAADGRADAAAAEAPSEAPPPNVRPIADARDAPALELASDGTWRPSGSTLSAQEDLDANARRRSVPTLRSRYPQLARGERLVLPPAPAAARFTQMTAPPPEAVPAEAPAPTATAPAAPEPEAPVMRGAPTIDRDSIIRAVAGGTEMVAGPFARFQQLAAFVKALRALPGVQDVTTRQFVRGMVHLRVRHSHAIALAGLLGGLTEFSPSIVSSTHDRIELTVEPPDDVPPARG